METWTETGGRTAGLTLTAPPAGEEEQGQNKPPPEPQDLNE